MTTNALNPVILDVADCSICQQPLPRSSTAVCPHCFALPTERNFAALVRGMLIGYDPKTSVAPVVIQAHMMTQRERDFAATMGTAMPPVVDTWAQMHDRATMQKLAALEGVAAGSVDVFYSASCVLDFVPAFEVALLSAARVLKPAGAALLAMKPGRLLAGNAAPSQAYRLDDAQYKLAEGVEAWSMTVGREWVYDTLRRSGLTPMLVHVSDPASGGAAEYVIGQRV